MPEIPFKVCAEFLPAEWEALFSHEAFKEETYDPAGRALYSLYRQLSDGYARLAASPANGG